jgi:hypothetical protein
MLRCENTKRSFLAVFYSSPVIIQAMFCQDRLGTVVKNSQTACCWFPQADPAQATVVADLSRQLHAARSGQV